MISSSWSSSWPSSWSTSRSRKYDVFISFRGEDTRKNFLNHLYYALIQHGILTYKDDVTLERGETIGPALMNAIRESHIALVILSENYADSSWCLNELSYIMKCKEEIGQIVIPIFYNVDSSDVRRQIERWVVKDKSWIKALEDLSNIAGWVTKHVANGHEAECIQEIIASILNKFPFSDSSVDDTLKFVGMEIRLEQLKSMLDIGWGGVRMVGIWGVGGGGKTTLAFFAYYEAFSKEIVTYADGLPLALIVLGSLLYDKDKDEWLNTLARLKDQPEMDIVEKLKISYDGLKSVEKELFLDIACFFTKKKKDEAIEILDACGFYPAIGVKVLKQKSLITVCSGGMFHMHDLIQEMAHYIVRGEHPHNPESYSRVWRKEDIEDICSKNAKMENDKIEAIECDASGYSFNFIMLLSNMKKLRFLKVTTTSFDEGPSFLSNELRYLNWSNYPASPFPKDFQPMKLLVLKIEKSLQKKLWEGYKYLPCLKEMKLSYMKELVKTPDISGLQCLQELILQGCKSLEEIHQSLGYHSSLIRLSVIHCEKLTRFPTIVKMDKLKILRLIECKALIDFPEIEAKMDNLVELYMNDVAIQVLPPCVGEYCINLISLKLESCSNLKSIQGDFHALTCLESVHVINSNNLGRMEGTLPRFLTKLDLSWCNLKDGEIPFEIGELSNLRELHLGCNDFARLDFSLSRLTRLKLLNLCRCENLVELPKLPSSLAILNADGCESLEVIGDDAHRRCKWLCDVSIRGVRKNINGGQRLLESMLQGKEVKSGCMILQLKGLEIPRGFEPRVVRGRRCTNPVPRNWHNDFSGFLFCIVLDNYGSYFDLPKINTRQKHERSTGDSRRMRDSQVNVYWEEAVNDNNTCMIYVSFGLLRETSWWDQTSNAVQIEIDPLDDGYRVSGCGFKLIPKTSETTTIDTSFDDVSGVYTCGLKIRHDIIHVSKSAFKFYIDYSLRPNLNVYLTQTQL